MPATYEPIASTTITGTPSEVTFSSIAATWTDLIVVCAATASTAVNLNIQFNGDTGTNYSTTVLAGSGTAASSTRESSQVSFLPGVVSTVPSLQIVYALSYSNTNVNKTVLAIGEYDSRVYRRVHLWRSTSAISSIRLFISSGTFSAGTVSLYGIKAA